MMIQTGMQRHHSFRVYGTNFTFTNNGKAHTGTLEKSGEKYILHYSDSNKTMEATISGKQMTIVISGSDSMRLVFETK